MNTEPLSSDLGVQLAAIIRKDGQIKRGHELHERMKREGYPNAKTTAELNRPQLIKWGQEQGAENVKTGWLDEIRTHEGSAKGGKTQGAIQGRINSENGVLAFGLHQRWHVLRDRKKNSKFCRFCDGKVSTEVA